MSLLMPVRTTALEINRCLFIEIVHIDSKS